MEVPCCRCKVPLHLFVNLECIAHTEIQLSFCRQRYSRECTTQGYPLAMPMYVVAALPLIKRLNQSIHQVWYSDDATTLGKRSQRTGSLSFAVEHQLGKGACKEIIMSLWGGGRGDACPPLNGLLFQVSFLQSNASLHMQCGLLFWNCEKASEEVCGCLKCNGCQCWACSECIEESG